MTRIAMVCAVLWGLSLLGLLIVGGSKNPVAQDLRRFFWWGFIVTSFVTVLAIAAIVAINLGVFSH